ncbi:MAG: hypothetical protein BWY65_01248 [Firmicutes bacterium ADurb.Bin373]|nr:MAG: hypothetical protein BWY65_01248 [Firmicutes bacterium ADurb.Bin373]
MRWIGAFDPWASSTTLMIRARAVSLPTLVASNLNVPSLLIVAPVTSSPAFLSAGKLSPVSMDSSTVEYPSLTTPSTGILSPGRTTIRSPISTSSTGISISWPFLITRACLGCRPTSFLIASDVRPLAIASRVFPSRTRVMIIALVS